MGSPSRQVPRSRQLIVTADDFGVDVRVNEAVERAFTQGILTSASLMVGADAASDAVERARRLPGLAVGLHITLADGRPVLSAKRIPALVDREGRFRNDLFGSGVRWFFRPAVRRQLAAEIDAQFAAFVRTGLVLDHANAHKHLHLHPTVGSLIVRIGRGYGLSALRIPDEPRRIVRRADPKTRIPRSFLRPVLSMLRRRAASAHLMVNDHAFGLAWSGAMTEERLLALIPLLPAGISELYAHPATGDSSTMPHAVPSYRYRDELDALTSPRVRAALDAAGITPTRFSSLAAAPPRAVAARRAEPA
jgi:hopanoid biosynthesis associated protein HpnK